MTLPVPGKGSSRRFRSGDIATVFTGLLACFAVVAVIMGVDFMFQFSDMTLVLVGLTFVALMLLLLGVLMHRNRRGEGFEALYDTLSGPVWLSDLSGDILSRNAVAHQEYGAHSRIELCLTPFTSDPAATVYCLAQRVRSVGLASETLIHAGQSRTIVAQTASRGRIIWQLLGTDLASDLGNSSEMTSLPFIEYDGSGSVVTQNAAADALFGTEVNHIDEIVESPPLRADGLHRLKSSPDQVYRVHLSTTDKGHEQAMFLPSDPAEIAGGQTDDLMEDLPVALARLEPDGRLIYANTAARNLLGDRATPGSQLAALIEGLGRSIPERLMETMKGRAQGRSEVARGKIDDREVFLQVTLTRLMINGEPSLLAVLSDATELKTLEAQFVQSQKMQAVGQLAGGVAHDFNNLLTAINGHCDLLMMRHNKGDPDHGDLQQIRQNANRAAGLVRQLLAFSRKQTLRPKVLDLRDVLDDLVHLLNRLLGARVSLEVACDDDLHPVRVDERQLEQVIVNLVVNARDAMPEGGEVRLSARNVTLDADMKRDRAVIPKGDYVLVEVRDSGTGIPVDKIDKIFEPFFTTKKLGEGTGLGLSTVYGIVKQTGGYIFANSTIDVGTTFQLYLPDHVQSAKEEVQVAASKTTPVDSNPTDLTGRGVVLLVEDEAPVRSFAARALQLRGYTVLEADCGEAALDMLGDLDLEIDLFLSDVIMPGLDGPSWVEQALKNRPNVPTIFVSGYSEDAFGEGRAEIPNSTFLPKPFSLNELTEKVKINIEKPTMH